MTNFLLKGILRDRSRSLMPIIVVAIGVFSVVVMDGFIAGMTTNFSNANANHGKGHLRVMTRAFQADEEQNPIDLALLGADSLTAKLRAEFPAVEWTPRITFGGLLDAPDSTGNTRVQGPVAATACDFLTPESRETERMGVDKALVSGRKIEQQGDILISVDFANNYSVQCGDTLTFFGSTMYGALTFQNFTVCGVVRFGISALDKGAVMMDISDAGQLLDMENAANSILGFLPEKYEADEAETIKQAFNRQYESDTDIYAPVMVKLTDDTDIATMFAYMKGVTTAAIVIIIFALGIVLWNTGILGGIRRYSEFGVRLAIGEPHGQIYRSLLLESLLIGFAGSLLGTVFGVTVCYWLQESGFDYSEAMKNINMMIDPVIRAEVTPRIFFIGFLPGVLAMLLGSALAGRAIYKRQTANLFKELD